MQKPEEINYGADISTLPQLIESGELQPVFNTVLRISGKADTQETGTGRRKSSETATDGMDGDPPMAA